MMTEWAHAAVSNLRSLRPPLVGVTGPRVKGGNAAILTHDFVHRTHLDVFPTYYPPALCDWWLDDWITLVYRPHRSTHLKSKTGPVWEVKHHTSKHGRRYISHLLTEV